MSYSAARNRPGRRALYRSAKRILYRSAMRRWSGSRTALERRIRAFLRGRNRNYLLRLVQQHAFAIAVAGALLAGAQAQASSPIELSGIAMDANAGGFIINGLDGGDWFGRSVSAAGDVNGDGLADVIVGAMQADQGASNEGESHVIFGKAGGTAVDLSNLGSGGFIIRGISAGDWSGNSVSGAGDVNGDGLADLIVGSPNANPGSDDEGQSYVVFGKSDGTAVELSNLGSGGFVINGIDAGDHSGISVSGAGDVNGDGLADLIVGAHNADPGGSHSGESYVVFGKASATAVDLSAIAMDANAGGFVMNGHRANDYAGFSVSGAGDVNGDGLADLIVGAYFANPGVVDAGESYVVFGKADGTSLELSSMGSGGFAIIGIDLDDRSGRSVSGAGDVNGDGLADLILGAFLGDPGTDAEGESYVVFGKAGTTTVELSNLGADGFVINGIDTGDFSGFSVSGAGDVNGDGLADLIIGAYKADPVFDRAGESYVVFGKASTTAVELSNLGSGGFVMNGIDASDDSGLSVSGAGDVNGDGLADLIVSAPLADGAVGESYVVFSPETPPSTATYKGRARKGDGAGGDPVVPLVLEDARMTMDYPDDDSADNGSGGASLETAALRRGLGDLTGLPAGYASTYWEWSTDRVNWANATFTFKYLDSDVAALLGAEADYTVYSATSKSGPWTAQTTTIDTARNTAQITMAVPGGASFFAIVGDAAPGVWVDFAWLGTESGTESEPFNTLGKALLAASPGDPVAIKGNTADSDSPETLTINQEVTLTAVGGTVSIGNPAARNARPRSADESKRGFVSRGDAQQD